MFFAVGLWSATRDPDAYFFHPSFGDLQEELATPRTEGKVGILVMFDNAECPWCAKMKTTVLNQVTAQDYFRTHFRIIQVDTEGDETLLDFNGVELP